MLIATTKLPKFPEFADAFLHIIDKKGRERPLIRNSIQKKYRTLKLRARRAGYTRFLVLKYRRGGITTEEQAQSFYQTLHKGQSAFTLAHTKEDTQKIFNICRLYYEKLSPDLRPERTRSIKKELVYPRIRSDYTIGTARAKASARGSTFQKLHGSEVAFWPGAADEIDSLLAGLVLATSHGEVVLETTANGHNHFYEKWKDAKKNPESDWVPIFLPWFRDDLNVLPLILDDREEIIESLGDDEKRLIQKFQLSLEHIKWRRRMQATLPRLFLQEFPEDDETAFLLTGQTYFDKFLVAEGLRNCAAPGAMQQGYTKWGGALRLWKPPIPGREYIAGSDVASGTEGPDNDWSVTAVIDKETGEHVASLTCQWKVHIFTQKSIDLCKLYNNAFWGIESQQHGHAVINLAEFVHNYKNLYRHVEYDFKGKTRVERKKRTGWPTNVKTRPIMLDVLAKAMGEKVLVSKDVNFWSEAKVFIADIHGKYQAANGEHDDHIFAVGIAWCIRNVKKRSPGVYVED
jgi:hypothetical protein